MVPIVRSVTHPVSRFEGRGPLLRGRSAVLGSGFGGSYANRRIRRGIITLSHALASLEAEKSPVRR
jgi:hypothetical protein